MAQESAAIRPKQRSSARADRPTALAVREAGSGAPLVLLHGLASSSRYWGTMRPMAGRYHVLAPDLLGFGRSPKPEQSRYGPEEHITALRRTLPRRAGGPFHLLGHSLGSLIALHYAVAYPNDVRTLTLVSLPVVGDCAWGHGVDGRMNAWHRFSVHTRPGNVIFNLGMRAAAPVWDRLGPRIRREIPPEATRDALAGTWTSYWRSLENVVYGTDVPSLIERVSAPILLLHGPDDSIAPVGPVRALAAMQAAPRLVEIAGAGHNPYFSHPDATAAALLAFLCESNERGTLHTPLAGRAASQNAL